jgi:hypothetical protein
VLITSLIQHIDLSRALPYSPSPIFVFITVHHSAFSVQINSCNATSVRLNPIVRRHGLRFRFDLSIPLEAESASAYRNETRDEGTPELTSRTILWYTENLKNTVLDLAQV